MPIQTLQERIENANKKLTENVKKLFSDIDVDNNQSVKSSKAAQGKIISKLESTIKDILDGKELPLDEKALKQKLDEVFNASKNLLATFDETLKNKFNVTTPEGDEQKINKFMDMKDSYIITCKGIMDSYLANTMATQKESEVKHAENRTKKPDNIETESKSPKAKNFNPLKSLIESAKHSRFLGSINNTSKTTKTNNTPEHKDGPKHR
jgi:hypothetical protein